MQIRTVDEDPGNVASRKRSRDHLLEPARDHLGLAKVENFPLGGAAIVSRTARWLVNRAVLAVGVAQEEPIRELGVQIVVALLGGEVPAHAAGVEEYRWRRQAFL